MNWLEALIISFGFRRSEIPGSKIYNLNNMAVPSGGYSKASQAAMQKEQQYMNTQNLMAWVQKNWIYLLVAYFVLTRKKLF